MKPAPARAAALEVLGEVRRREGFAPAILESVLARRALSPADRALATRLSYGTLQSEGTLDEALGRFLDRPGGVEPRVRDALRLSAYELLFTRTPARAAVNEGVEAVRRARPQAAGMGNAVLRKLADAAQDFPWGDARTDYGALARATAHPLWMVEALVADVGDSAARRVLAANGEPAPLYLAVNPFRSEMATVLDVLAADGAEPQPMEPEGCILAGRPDAAVRSRVLPDGLAIVIDAAAQLAPLVLDPRPGDTVVDLTAGRGGKTLLVQAHAAARGAPAEVFALDLHAYKSRVLAERMEFLGVPRVTALVGDATDPGSVEGLPPAGSADRVLLDAPCSNLGTLRRHPEKRWRLQPADIGRLAELQGRLLTAAASLVRPGGLMVYSTCSVSRTENADVVGSFLVREAGAFRVRPVADLLPRSMRRFANEEGTFQSLPEASGPDGHFVAALQRVE